MFIVVAVAAVLGPFISRADNQTPADKPESDDKAKSLLEPQVPGRFYGGIEYLYWWAKPAPLSVPLVSSGPIAATHHGLLGVPAVDASETSILYGAPHDPAQGGNDSQAFRGFSGGRLTAGYYLDEQRCFAIEGSGFVLQQQNAGYQVRGGTDGNPVLGIPVYNSKPYQIGTMIIQQGEDSLPFSLPDSSARARANGIITGGTYINNKIDFWGADLSGVISLYHGANWEVSGVIGPRYLDLSESFSMTTDIEGITGPYKGQYGTVSDNFSTRNEFYGADLGLRGKYTDRPWSVEITAKVAPGVNHGIETVAGGFDSYFFSSPHATGPEGVFAQPANEGQTTSDRFCIVPELDFKIGYELTPWLTATFGYDFLYMSSVIRPTDQIDRGVPKGQTFNQADPTIATDSPAKKYQVTDFFMHGITLGLEFSF
jgi:hypothetical protein